MGIRLHELSKDMLTTDGAGKVTVARRLITTDIGDQLTSRLLCYVKDLGAGNIGDFTHKVDVNVTAQTN